METSILDQVATSQVIMMETIIYAMATVIILLLLDMYAVRSIGDRRRPAYKALRIHKQVAFFIVAVVTAAIGIACLFFGWTVTRGTLTYFGLPYFVTIVYYMVKVFRRTRSEVRRRKL
jgi:EamA domain-containing membrane protein RarD